MNWDDARVFLAVEREKTLRGAARTLNLDQATVGRRIAALEHALRATYPSAQPVRAVFAAKCRRSFAIESTKRASGHRCH